MGYILDGVYHKGNAPISDMMGSTRSGFKEWDHDRQREDHRAELVQPYNRDGSPNEDFIDIYPEESKQYGFIKEEKE